MTYLDVKRLQTIDPASFRVQTPYPRVTPAGLLTNAGYDRLRETPQGHLRKVFIVVINRYSPLDRVRRFFGEPPRGDERERRDVCDKREFVNSSVLEANG